jgi:hypothetical protein
MLGAVLYFVIPALVILVVAYFYIEVQKTKIQEDNKKALTLRVVRIKDNFRADLKRLAEQQILTLTGLSAVYRVANNFFVFQPVTENNLVYCEHLLKSVVCAIPAADPDKYNFDFLQEQVNLFIRALPVAASGYNASFYREKLPQLIKQLVESLEKAYEIEDDHIKEALPDIE